MIKLKNILEKFDSKAQQRFLYATDKEAAEKKASKMTKKDYKELPDKVNEGHTTTFSKEEMAKLHKDGTLEKDGHTYVFTDD